MSYKPVDTAIVMVVGPCIDDADFKSLEESIAYDAAGMDISLIVEKTDGTSTVTAITLTTGGTSDWTHKDGAYYEVEITAAQNAEEGIAYLRGVCTGVLPFESPRYDIEKANIYDSLRKGTDNLQVDVTQLLDTAWLTPGVAGTPDVNAKQLGGIVQTGRDIGANVLLSSGSGAGQLDFTSGIVKSNLTQILAHLLTQTGTQLADGFEKFFDVGTPTGTVNSLPDAAPDATGGLSISSEYDGELEDIHTLLGNGGDIFYVSKTGDNSDGTTWAKAKNTIDAAIALCTADHCDKISIGCGTYDEASATAGVVCDVAGIKIIGAMPGVIVKNTNTTNGSKVFHITANNVWLHNMTVEKGETTSDNAICIDVDGAYISADIRDVTIAVEKANHTGIRFTGGAVGSGYVNGPMAMSYIYSAAGVGTGIEAANCNNCVAIAAQFHTLTTGIKFTGGANCHDNMVSPYAMISSCTIGISLTAGCYNNMLSALTLNCTTNYVDDSGVDTNKTDGSLTFVLDDIKASIVEASPQIHLATASSAVTHGTVDSGTYADTNTDNDIYWQISPDAVNALDMHSQFLIGTGRTPSAVDFNGRFQGHISRYCEVAAWNYDTSDWETISSDSNRIGHATADFDRQFALTPSHVKSTDGEMKIRVKSTSTTIGDDLYIDKLIIASVAQAAGGLTADAVATTVWNRDIGTFVGAQTAGSRLRRTVSVGTEISVSNTATSFTVASGETTANAYRGMEIRIGCSTEDYCETRRIIDWTAGRVVTLDRALSNIPQVGDLVRILNQYSEVDTTAIKGADPTDTINAACDTALTDYDPPTRTEATADKDAIITKVNANETKIDIMQGNVTDILTDTNATIPGTITTLQTDSTAIKAKTDALPSGITKNVALPDFQVYMVLSSDHVTEATGKTIVGTISKDGGAFAAITNSITEIASGIYKVDLTQAEMNADVVTLKFTETDCDQRIITIYTS